MRRRRIAGALSGALLGGVLTMAPGTAGATTDAHSPVYSNFFTCVGSTVYTDFTDPDGGDETLRVTGEVYRHGVPTIIELTNSGPTVHGVYFYLDLAPYGFTDPAHMDTVMYLRATDVTGRVSKTYGTSNCQTPGPKSPLWLSIGFANNVTAMAFGNGKLWATTSDNKLWWRDPVFNVDWQHIGHANDVTALTFGNGRLWATTKDNQLWRRDPVGANLNWQRIGHANEVTALAFGNGQLWATTKDNRLWRRDPVAADVNWQHIGHANNVTAMTFINARLYAATMNGELYSREPVGADIVWTPEGPAREIKALASMNSRLVGATTSNWLLWREPT